MKKRSKENDGFSSTEVGALIEALRSEIKPVLEAIPDMQKKLDSIFEQVGINTEKIVLLEIAVKNHSERIAVLETTVKGLETSVKVNSEKTDRVLEELKSKVTRGDFEILEKKVASFIGS